MPFVAIGDEKAAVTTNHGCDLVTTSDECSSKVFIGGTGVVLYGHKTAEHSIESGTSCVAHTVTLSTCSAIVFAEGKGVCRQDDTYS